MKKIAIIDFGSQYTQLIARRVREINVYCEIYPYTEIPFDDQEVQGIILSGSPFSVRQANSPRIDIERLSAKAPVLGVCYGAQLIAHTCGGSVQESKVREYGRARLASVDNTCVLFKDIPQDSQVWMSHGDSILNIPSEAKVVAGTSDIPVAAFSYTNKHIYGVQFHPEVYHSEHGTLILKSFAYDVCAITPDWTPDSYVESTVASLKQTLGNDKVVLGLSGGVDSTVAALLLQKAIGDNLYCIFVDNGLLRKNEFINVLEAYKSLQLNVKGVDASDEFIDALQGANEPEQKRKIIGKVFIDVFDREATRIEDVKWLAQGTIYPDIIESKSVKGPSATIKSHHNVGGLPDYMKLKVVEPLSALFKDEVRKVGKVLGLHDSFTSRHPFPGPGLGIRILGEITRSKLEILREADDIFISALKTHNLYDTVWQACTIFLPVQSVGVMGDERTYENAICLRAVTSTDGMTADWVHLPYEFLALVSNDIINKVRGVNRVVYDISSKPPATIEWE